MFQFIANHSWEITLGAFWMFSAFVGGMPDPDGTSGKGYVWMFRSLHMLSGNLATAFSAKGPGQVAAQKGYSRPGATLVLASLLAVLIACSTSWVAQAEAIISLLVPAAGNVLSLITAFAPGAVSEADVLLVQQVSSEAQRDLKLVGDLIQQYESASAQDKPGIYQKIDAGLKDARQNLDSILAAGHIKDAALKAKVQAVVDVALSELDSLEQIVAAAQGAAPSHARVKPPLSAKAFKKQFNSAMVAPSGSAEVDQAAKASVLK